jgi:hypothetical protein
MFPESNINDITHVIQLAIAPVFLLTAVGTIIGVLANRLARIVDRIRAVEDWLRRPAQAHAEAIRDSAPDSVRGSVPDRQRDSVREIMQNELSLLGRRLRLVYLAMALAVFCALFVGLLIVVAFVDAFVQANLAKLIGVLFVLAMIAFIGGLLVFLREIFLAVTSTQNTMR